ncbi:anhydro-N-acetylmuramic acid kinase [Sporolactobacillus sp. THM7-4]|nr:anhydro-N-acetylmuramic acid kinase [Sporolactobacillus sp. THM7-4]
MNEKIIVGLMSGTSADGIDAALTRITGSGERTQIEILDFITFPYSSSLRKKVFLAMNPDRSHVQLICSLNFELGTAFADAVKAVCVHAGFDIERLNLIGSHGQTIYHMPRPEKGYDRSTLQIGEPAVIAFETRTPVVSNFRTMDMAAGGQGAPLIAYVDYLLFKQHFRTVALLNIGGIANLTVLPAGGSLADVTAFDTGPGNMVVDALVQKFYGKPYDRDGVYAASGTVNPALLREMMNDPYLTEKPPKSTGRERYGLQYAERITTAWSRLKPDDLIATATCFTAKAILKNYQKLILPRHRIEEMRVSGGGRHNPVMMKWLKEMLPDVSIQVFDQGRLNADAREAAAFAVLANETVHGQPANVPGATGAKEPLILGNYTPFIKNDGSGGICH